MSDEPTLPPVRQPNTPRVWWRKAAAAVAAHPDWALAAFLVAFAAALVL